MSQVCSLYEVCKNPDYSLVDLEYKVHTRLYESCMKFLCSLYQPWLQPGSRRIQSSYKFLWALYVVCINPGALQNTKFLQTSYNHTLGTLCMNIKFFVNEVCMYFVWNMSFVWILYLIWDLDEPCMQFIWGIYDLCM